MLTTSRESLRVQGERLHRLSALPSRPASAHLSAAEALGFPAVQLFVECAAESSGEFELSDADVPLVSEICRKGCAAEKAMQKKWRRKDPTPQDIAWSGGQEPSCAEPTALWLTKG
ncbi:MAG TPA: hypothetical protein VH230_00310 [Stellaceae bacterium]|jgi:predicted ATPase|nr:hypothetical protein [Stellaceae bacterium]